MIRHLGLCLLLLAAFWVTPTAKAATVCTATSTPMIFPQAGPTQVDSNAVVTVTCNTFGLSLLATARVRMCLNLDGGSVAPAQIVPRRMQNSFGDPLNFQLYSNPAHTVIWGGSAAPGVPAAVQIDLEYGVPVLGGAGTATTTIYGRVPAQSGLAAGTFTNSFAAANAVLTYRYSEALLATPPWPTSCLAGGNGGASTGFPFTASAPVASRCTISTATDLDFGNVPGAIATNRDQTSAVTFTCTGRTAWNVGLDNGIHAAGTTRRMRLGTSANYVRYELYRDAGHSQRWGTTAGTDTASGTGSGGAQTVTVQGRVPAGQMVPAGTYADTVTVTITY
ncbi:spore coat U domain-containing protein [Luteimonas fraxinea]|uniref:Spore coat U domain-containing protein n=1 Tax=Luteimonas fraxinea TaxID=2901869 RepID=A0ABS8UH52_9GAMM|nr:spore coat U domain-containing protein [Luteimonas fraxinea]MCD9098805.1 spore coat U domain-containing protein [Luteimonas fraxinea]MCD9127448.1 spore coat U domain-containing protein [Luteimonas fraxinea]UHH10458.1 spore coat U domain-containing protein [Luteimonas fraxinea]